MLVLRSRAYNRVGLEVPAADPSTVIKEHSCAPPSYVAHSNLKNIVANTVEIMSLLNREDQLPAWVTDMLSRADQNLVQALEYIRGQKTAGPGMSL